MTNYRKAPRFYHNGTKVLGERFYQLPQQLMDIIFHKFDGKNGNVLKLLMVLIGTKGDGSFGISENWIKERTGIDKQNYHRSLDKLIALGYVTRENGKIILNLEAIMEDGHSEEQDSHRQSEEADQEAAAFDSDDDRETTKI